MELGRQVHLRLQEPQSSTSSPHPKKVLRYTHLSPAKSSKRKPKLNSQMPQNNSKEPILNSSIRSELYSQSIVKKAEQSEILPVRIEQPFRTIKKFNKNELLVRSPNISNISENRQNKESRKVKLTISKNINNRTAEKPRAENLTQNRQL